jgi:hypothetical protein
MGMVIGIKPEHIAEYKRTHAAVWPEVLARISDSNIRNYTIFLREPENLLFAYCEYTAKTGQPTPRRWRPTRAPRNGGRSTIRCRRRSRLARRVNGGDGGRSVSSRLRRARDWPPGPVGLRQFT